MMTTSYREERRRAPSSASTFSMTTAPPTMNRRRIARAFKMRGLSVQSSAIDAALNVLSREGGGGGQQQRQGVGRRGGSRGKSSSSSAAAAADDVLFAIVDEIKSRMTTASSSLQHHPQQQLVVTRRMLAEVVSDLSRSGDDVTDESVQYLDAFSTPRLSFDPMRKSFELRGDRDEVRSLFGKAVHKVEMLSQRYELIRQRLMRQEPFRPRLVTASSSGAAGGGRRRPGTAAAAAATSATHTLTPVESLLGRTGVRFLLGMIVQVEEGRYYLEDHTSSVPLDLSRTTVLTDGFLTENCIVLVEGEYIDGTLHVHRMGHPLVESRSDASDAIGLAGTDLFGAASTLSELERLREEEASHGEDGTFVVLSDVHLDDPAVLEKLDVLFEGFRHHQPLPVFVFLGNFASRPMSAARDGRKAVAGHFEDLAAVLGKYPELASEGRFVFVPGPNDPGLAGCLPRPPIPNCFTSALRSKVPHAVFATNPCRIRYFSREIVVCREDVVSMLRRNCLVPPRADGDDGITGGTGGGGGGEADRLAQHAVKTLLDQGHLCPLPLPSRPVHWQFDHALRLYPLPDALIVGDRVDQHYQNYAGCDAINPGSFPGEFNFVVYRPVAEVRGSEVHSDVEFSQIG